MFEKLDAIKQRYDHLTNELSKSEVINNNNEWKKLAKEHSGLTDIVECYDEWKKADTQLNDSLHLLENESDKEMQELLKSEIDELRDKKQTLEEQLKVLLLPVDPNDHKNVILEIRAGAGGEESALFAYEIQRMYAMFAERNHWKVEELDLNQTELGGVKESTLMIIGNGAYSKFKYESGVHRVQRVPETESQGRIHTSTITVAVLPEVPDVEVEI